MTTFEFTVTDEAAQVTYTPWTDGHAVGFRVQHPTGEVEFIYLNPSGDSDGGTPDVFLYQGPHGDSGQDFPQHYYELLKEAT